MCCSNLDGRCRFVRNGDALGFLTVVVVVADDFVVVDDDVDVGCGDAPDEKSPRNSCVSLSSSTITLEEEDGEIGAAPRGSSGSARVTCDVGAGIVDEVAVNGVDLGGPRRAKASEVETPPATVATTRQIVAMDRFLELRDVVIFLEEGIL